MHTSYKPFRKIYTIRVFILAFFCFAQSVHGQSPVSINWSKPNLLTWDSTWTFKPGYAEAGYFTRNFNDSAWQQVHFAFLDTLMSGTKDFTDRGTLRRKFYIPDSLKGTSVDLFFNICGAAEIYYDGKLLYRAGQINGTIKNSVIFQQTIPLQLDSLPWHVVAIYCASSIPKDLVSAYGVRGIGITMVSAATGIEDNNDSYHHMIISLGIIAGFGLFFWFVFAFYPKRISSLITALLLTNFTLIFFGAMIRERFAPDLAQFVIGEKLWEIGFGTSFGWWLIFLYSVYYKKIPKHAFIVAAMMLTSILMIVFKVRIWFTVTVVFLVLYALEFARMLIKGIIKRKTGFRILGVGYLLSIIGTLSVIFNVFHFFPYYITPLQTVLGITNDLIFPLTMALHLAWEFGSANRDLRRQLVQVQQLSDKSVEQEKEKQQILASQNETLEYQVTKRTSELNKSLEDLKSAQQQLVQSEKMASLGQLTAGIAHEIQNPLNFVNNFAQINSELIEEAKQEAGKGNNTEVANILNDVKQNEEKIVLHGKRAESIVKNMLEHSRSSSGKKEPTDINALAEEYLKLAYHGMRAKDKSFNAELETVFDAGIGKANIVSQDLGRVFLNLYNNAFYAVNEKSKQQHSNGYQPKITVTTTRNRNRLEVKIRDNGTGIPKEIQGSIFQPFFTTKPTGQGTGLGLSLSYDIIKANGGEIKVDSVKDEYTEFSISLPANET
ncbi:MAG: ATP-binding protein [Nitrospira sp.]